MCNDTRVLCGWTLKAKDRGLFAAKPPASATIRSGRGYLDGQLLIAMPVMGDPRFERSVIYLCAHSSEGAMGIIVNHPAGSIDFPELLVQLDIIEKADQIKLPENAETMKVLKGGPVETGRGFVLHSSDFFIEDATLQDRRRHLPDRDGRYSQGDRQGRRAEARDPRARLCRLGAGTARNRNPGQWLAALRCRSGPDLRRRRRGKIPAGAAQDRNRSGHAVHRRGACLSVVIAGARDPAPSARATAFTKMMHTRVKPAYDGRGR